MAAEGKAGQLDPEVYLKKHHVMTYIEDAVTFLLERKDEDSKTKPFELLADYFKSVKNGTHILFREYSFVSLTPHNRASFVKLLWLSYAQVATRGEMMKVVEYLSLLRLVCHDFPSELVQKVARVIFSHNAMESVTSFPDFLYTFQVVFYYEHFLTQCEKLCSSIASGHPHHVLSGTTVIVPMPSLGDQDSSRPNTAQEKTEPGSSVENSKQVDAEVFSKAVTNLIQKLQDREPWHGCPSAIAVREVLSGVTKMSFYDFVLALSKSERINAEIGVLPCKTQFPTGSSPALFASTLYGSSSGGSQPS